MGANQANELAFTASPPTAPPLPPLPLAFHFAGNKKHPQHLNCTATLAGHPVWFLSPPLCFDTQQEQPCMLFVRFLLRWRRPGLERAFSVVNGRGLTPSKASITIRRVMGLARVVWKSVDLQKAMRHWGEGMFGAKTYFILRDWRFSMCVKLNLGCLYRWEAAMCWPTMNWQRGAHVHVLF